MRSGKTVNKPPLPDSSLEEVVLPLSFTKKLIQRKVVSTETIDQKMVNQDEVLDRQSMVMVEASTSESVTETIGESTIAGIKQSVRSSESLLFLSEEERDKVLFAAEGMEIS